MALVGSALVHAATPPAQAGRDGDVVVLPSAGYEEFRSPSGTHVLGLRVGDHLNAHSARSAITLYRVTAYQRMTLWTRELPHRPRPRFLLVADGGHVVLLDEWLNVRSNYAAMVIGPDNRVLGQYDLESIRATLQFRERASDIAAVTSHHCNDVRDAPRFLFEDSREPVQYLRIRLSVVHECAQLRRTVLQN